MESTEEKVKHTPGPWCYNGLHGVVADENGNPKLVAMLPKHEADRNPHQYDANGKLIAAAPEMLKALIEAKELIRIWQKGVDEEADKHNWEIYNRKSPEMQRINKASAKATGQG